MADNITLVKDDLLIWSNSDNTELYENMPLEEFYKIAVIGGLDSGKDIDVIMPYVHQAKSILEVGAGYGRVLNHLITRGYNQELSAIERSKKLCQWLQSQYQHCATILEGSLMMLTDRHEYDLILWMWAGLAEFSRTEQLTALDKLAQHLTPQGRIILDMIPLDKKALNSIAITEQEQVVETNYGTDHCYVPSDQEIMAYAQSLNLNTIEKISYQSLPNRTRWLYVLSR